MNPTKDKLLALKLLGMIRAIDEQESHLDEYRKQSFEDRLGLIVDAEYAEQQNQQFAQRLKQARLRHSACFEDIDTHKPRGLDRHVLLQLAACGWVRKGVGIMLDGPTGIGKSYIACALAHKACRSGYTALYYRAPRLFQDLLLSRMKGTYTAFLKRLAKIDVLVVDDFALCPVNDEQSRDLLEVVDDRITVRPLIIASQLPVGSWHSVFSNATVADAIIDRVINGAYKISLQGATCRPSVTDLPDD